MKEMFGRRPPVLVDVGPPAAAPGEFVDAQIVARRPVDRVSAAHVEWGYTNFYRYHWAGRTDSAMAPTSDSLWLVDQVYAGNTGDRDADEWVKVVEEPLPVVDGVFAGGSARFRVPSWAPASSPELVRWSCRVILERAGRDVDVHGDFSVRVRRTESAPPDGGVERIAGDAQTVLDIDLATTVCVAGEPIRGQVRVMPTANLPDGDVAVCWQRCRDSHPLTRRPSRGGSVDGPILTVAKPVPLRAGVGVALPFELPLPVDAAPTARAVHSSMRWFVQARMFYAGFTGPLTERVVHPIVVVNDP
jgi:hypothetical protein